MAGSIPFPAATRRLEGKVALVTSGDSGIVECIARVFYKHGAKVIIVNIQNHLAESVCKDLESEVASFVYCDVSKESNIENAINTTIAKHGNLNIVINNATIVDTPKLSILDNDTAEFEQVISINLTSVFLGIKHAARVMILARRGSIITLSSVSSSVGRVTSQAYTSLKHAIVGLTKNVAAELGLFRICVNCLSPYFISTLLT